MSRFFAQPPEITGLCRQHVVWIEAEASLLEIHFLGSGSRGNAALIRWDQTRILLDCGFSGRELSRRLTVVGQDSARIDALLLTHEHNDHVVGLAALAKRSELTVYSTPGTGRASRFGKRPQAERKEIEPGRPFQVGQLEVEPFSICHDARDPVGYVFHLPDGTRLGIATDLGHPNPEAVEALRGCEYLGLESNHDPRMLEEGPYPWILKRRIRSDSGHLSNPRTSELLSEIAADNLRHLFALHLSQTNNTPERARKVLQEGLVRIGSSAELTVVGQEQPVSHPPLGQMPLL